MSCDPVSSFEFNEEQSKELSDLVIEFLTKHLTEEVAAALAIEIEFKFSPLPEGKIREKEKLRESFLLFKEKQREQFQFLTSVGGGGCVPAPGKKHVFCGNVIGWTWQA
jgi:hypothetical protein